MTWRCFEAASNLTLSDVRTQLRRSACGILLITENPSRQKVPRLFLYEFSSGDLCAGLPSHGERSADRSIIRSLPIRHVPSRYRVSADTHPIVFVFPVFFLFRHIRACIQPTTALSCHLLVLYSGVWADGIARERGMRRDVRAYSRWTGYDTTWLSFLRGRHDFCEHRGRGV